MKNEENTVTSNKVLKKFNLVTSFDHDITKRNILVKIIKIESKLRPLED